MVNRKIYRSKKRELNHVVIMADLREEDKETISKELEKATWKMRRLFKNKFSYEIHLVMR